MENILNELVSYLNLDAQSKYSHELHEPTLTGKEMEVLQACDIVGIEWL